MINVLLFPSGSQVANEAYNALKYEKNITCFGADFGFQNWSAYEMENYDSTMPLYNENTKQSFVDALKKHIQSNNIHCVIPCFDKFIYILKELEKELECTIIAPDASIALCCESKRETYNVFKQVITVPKLFKIEDMETKHTLEEPIFIKPANGYGSRDSHLVKTIDEFNYYKTKYNLHDFVICEYLPGEEFTVDCLSTENELLICNPRKRLKTMQGISVNTEVALDQNIIDACWFFGNSIVNKIKIKGAWFFQVKFNKDHQLCLLEIAPRIAGAMCLTRNLGINLPLMSIHIHLGNDVMLNKDDSCFVRTPKSVYKTFKNLFLPKLHFSTLFIDLDDTIVIKHKVNTECISFIYNCKNDNKHIVCLTRNRDPCAKLLQHNISSSLFDCIYSVGKNEKKSSFINAYAAKMEHMNTIKCIFVDDSYAERKDVQTHCKNVTVFAVDQIESLV
jgi:predicted ATP-grasp superfamily ATP-dependent carboligase